MYYHVLVCRHIGTCKFSRMFNYILSAAEIGRLKAILASKPYDTNEKGCHLWMGSVDVRGYGKLYLSVQTQSGPKIKGSQPVHRLAVYLANDGIPIDDRLHASHLCHIGHCFNTLHLTLESSGANQERRDCVAQGQCRGHENRPDCIL